MKICPCCRDNLLRHVGTHGIYWFCRGCRQSMPILAKAQNVQRHRQTAVKVTSSLSRANPSKSELRDRATISEF